jgi:hypothetical protein
VKKFGYVVIVITLSLHSIWSAGMGVVIIGLIESYFED